ncbi:Gp37-like protein [Streptomyces syringium]|uniref:Gp37-like protein n=1 Tax=Streptomyces syringium TaxID=76729 RepID=UPI0034520059
MRRYRVDVRDTALRRIGQIDAYTNLDVIVRHLDVGTWSLTLPAAHPQARLLTTGQGVIIWPEGSTGADAAGGREPLLSGPVSKVRHDWSNNTGTDGTLTFTGTCDNVPLAERLAFPDPARAPDTGNGRYSVDYWTRQGPAADIVRELVAANLGERALPGRRVTGLDTIPPPGTPAATGPAASARLRFDTVLSAVQTLASGAGLSVRIVHPDPTAPRLALTVAPVRDRSREVRLSPQLGNLAAYAYELTAPKATRAVVAAQGKGADRFFWQWTTPEAERDWARSAEVFVDQRDTPVPAHLDATDAQFAALAEAAGRALEQGGQQAELSLSPIDTPQMTYGLHYQVGDTVTVTTVGGTDLAYPVREVHITDTADTSTVQATVGTASATKTPALYGQVRRLWQAVHQLNTRH